MQKKFTSIILTSRCVKTAGLGDLLILLNAKTL